MARIVRGDSDPVDYQGLEEAHALDFRSASFNFGHPETIKLFFFFPVRHDFPIIFEHDGEKGFCGSGGQNGSFVAVMFCEVGKGAAVIQMEMSYDDEVNHIVDSFGGRVEFGEVGVSPMVSVEHVNSHIEHDGFVGEGN